MNPTKHFCPNRSSRMARAYIAETEGVFSPAWTIDRVADNIEAIRDPSNPWTLPPVPSGYIDHMEKSFEMVRKLTT